MKCHKAPCYNTLFLLARCSRLGPSFGKTPGVFRALTAWGLQNPVTACYPVRLNQTGAMATSGSRVALPLPPPPTHTITSKVRVFLRDCHKPCAAKVMTCQLGRALAVALSCRGEVLSFWSVLRRSQAARLVLLGYYILPCRMDQPIESTVNPVGLEVRSRKRVWNTPEGRLKFIVIGCASWTHHRVACVACKQ